MDRYIQHPHGVMWARGLRGVPLEALPSEVKDFYEANPGEYFYRTER